MTHDTLLQPDAQAQQEFREAQQREADLMVDLLLDVLRDYGLFLPTDLARRIQNAVTSYLYPDLPIVTRRKGVTS